MARLFQPKSGAASGVGRRGGGGDTRRVASRHFSSTVLYFTSLPSFTKDQHGQTGTDRAREHKDPAAHISSSSFTSFSWARKNLSAEITCGPVKGCGRARVRLLGKCSLACQDQRPSLLNLARGRAPLASRVGTSEASTRHCPMRCRYAVLGAPSHQRSSHTLWC